jgi:hypothetical protein
MCHEPEATAIRTPTSAAISPHICGSPLRAIEVGIMMSSAPKAKPAAILPSVCSFLGLVRNNTMPARSKRPMSGEVVGCADCITWCGTIIACGLGRPALPSKVREGKFKIPTLTNQSVGHPRQLEAQNRNWKLEIGKGRWSTVTSKSTFPVPWPAMAVGNGQDRNRSIDFAINHQERKTGELEFASAECGTRPAMRRFEDSVDCLIEFGDKSC